LTAYTLAVGLLNRDAASDRHRGLELMMQSRDLWMRKRALFLIPVTDLWGAREKARRGDGDAAIEVMRHAVDELREAGNLFYGFWGTGLLVETLLERGAEGDLAEAEAAIERLAGASADEEPTIRGIWLLRLRALLSKAHGDAAAYAHFRDRYRDMAKTLGFEGHIAWAEAMIKGGE
jgi:ATP/maltotriose-dependent transcriptional regulator MalT